MYYRLILLLAMTVLVLTGSVSAYENPRYVTSGMRPDSTVDTLAILTFLTDPAYLQPSELEITWVGNRKVSDSLRVYPELGQLCSFRFDKRSHTWHGDYLPGDTLRCKFTVTPLDVGPLGLAFRVDLGPRTWKMLHAGFNLDETGRVVYQEAKKRYGMLGPTPEHMGDSLYFIGAPCYQGMRGDEDEAFGLVARISPALGPNHYSELVVRARPTCDLEHGAYYQLTFDDIFDIKLEDGADWPRVVESGEELVIRALVKPVRSGLGAIGVGVVGYRPEHEPTSKGGLDRGGRIVSSLGMHFAVDANLEVIASYRRAFQKEPDEKNIRAKGRNDAYRMHAIESLRGETAVSKVSSDSFLTRQQELHEQFKKKRR